MTLPLVLSLAGIAVPDGSSGFLGQVDAAVPASISNPWVLGACAVLALGEGGLDKVLSLNLPLEAVSQVLRSVVEDVSAPVLVAALRKEAGRRSGQLLGECRS